MAFSEDRSVFFDTETGFAVRARWEPGARANRQWANVIRSAPDALLFGGDVHASDVSIEFDASDFVGIATNDYVAIDDESYRVRQVIAIEDGGLKVALLRVSS